MSQNLLGNLARQTQELKQLRKLRSLIRQRTPHVPVKSPEDDDVCLDITLKLDRPIWVPEHRQYCVHLSRDSRVKSMDLPAGTEVYYSTKGRLTSVLLARDCIINKQDFSAGTTVHFFPEGGIDWISLDQDTQLNSWQKDDHRLPARRMASYYKNGHLKETILAKNFAIHDHLFLENTIVHFSNEGCLVWAQLAGPTSFLITNNPVMANAHTCVEFNRNGNVRALRLAQDMSFQGHRFTKGSQVQLDADGRLMAAHIFGATASKRSAAGTLLRFEKKKRSHQRNHRLLNPYKMLELMGPHLRI